MMATGTGTTLTSFDCGALNGLHIVIIKPGIHISTAEAYAGVTPRMPDRMPEDILRLPPDQWRGLLVNDFEASLAYDYPQIGDLRNSLYAHGAVYASMSGSGSAVYGLFADDKMAEAASAIRPDCDVFVGKMMLF